jgi:hypothetical protein
VRVCDELCSMLSRSSCFMKAGVVQFAIMACFARTFSQRFHHCSSQFSTHPGCPQPYVDFCFVTPTPHAESVDIVQKSLEAPKRFSDGVFFIHASMSSPKPPDVCGSIHIGFGFRLGSHIPCVHQYQPLFY